MSYRVHRTRLAFALGGTLLLGTLLLAPGLAAAAPRGQSAPAPRGAVLSSAESILDRLRVFLDHLWDRGRAARPTAGPALQNVHGSAGCGIDPNGTGCPGGGVP